jgi:C-terminal processing protease CtpA/Prc
MKGGHFMRRIAWACILGGALAAIALEGTAQSPPKLDSARTDRLVGLAKVWAAAKYFHPYLAYRDIDWDLALVAAIPKVNVATTAGEYAEAVQHMLTALADPATFVRAKPTEVPPGARLAPVVRDALRVRDPRSSLDDDGILTVVISNYDDLDDWFSAENRLKAIAEQATGARGIVFDLRSESPAANGGGFLDYLLADPSIAGKFVPADITLPRERRRMHSGFAPQGLATTGGYFSATYLVDGAHIKADAKSRARPIVFLVNRNSELPRLAVALQAEGRATIIADGSMPGNDAMVTRTGFVLPGGIVGELRLGETVNVDGSAEMRADTIVASKDVTRGDEALQYARAVVRDGRALASLRPKASAAAHANRLPDDRYAGMTYPSVEYRLLAAFRVWAVFEYFFPYKDLIGEDWEGILREFIPRFEAAANATEYALAIAEMTARTRDSHVRVDSTALRAYFGDAAPPLSAQMIEGVLVVTRSLGENACQSAGIGVGDVILAIDGERVDHRYARLARYYAASTPQALDWKMSRVLLRGTEGSLAALLIDDGTGRERDVILTRRQQYVQPVSSERTGEVARLLPGNIGYADLNRLLVSEVDAMFEMFKETRAIIFDMRGYPNGTAFEIAPRLARNTSPRAATFRKPVAMEPRLPGSETGNPHAALEFDQHISRTDKGQYPGRTVMLIDERAISQAEHSGLFLKAANGTRFVGSPTNGSNGDITGLFLPGDIQVSFTGQGVRFPDGTQLQRVGLVPDVLVRPTVRGIRSGRDEVLERAVEWLNGK